MADWISLREYSRRRNVTLGAVQKAIASGRVTAVRRDDKGRLVAIDAELATQQWSTNTDPDLALRTGTVVPPPDRIPTREDAQRVSEDASGGLLPSDAESFRG